MSIDCDHCGKSDCETKIDCRLQIKKIDLEIDEYNFCKSCEKKIKSIYIPESSQDVSGILFCFEWKRPTVVDLEQYILVCIAPIIIDYYAPFMEFKILNKINYETWSILQTWLNRANKCGAIFLDSFTENIIDDDENDTNGENYEKYTKLIKYMGEHKENTNRYNDDHIYDYLIRCMWQYLAPIVNKSIINLVSSKVFLKKFTRYLRDDYFSGGIVDIDNDVWFEPPRSIREEKCHIEKQVNKLVKKTAELREKLNRLDLNDILFSKWINIDKGIKSS